MNARTLLRSARAELGWSQRDLARRCGVAQPSISDIESGDRDTTVATLGRILKATHFSLVGVPTSLPTIADWAARLAKLLRDDPGGVEKSLVQIADDLAAVDPATRVALCITPPPPTGAGALDGVLAGLVEFLCRVRGCESLPGSRTPTDDPQQNGIWSPSVACGSWPVRPRRNRSGGGMSSSPLSFS